MSIAAAPPARSAHVPSYAPRLTHSVETLRRALLWMTGLFGAFVFMEPSPYEVAALLAMVAFLATGLTLSAALMPLVVLLILHNVGFAIAVIPVLDQPKTLQWVLVSAYLAATALFFAAMLGRNTQARLSILLTGYTLAAVIAALAGIVGYFRLVPATDLFLLYDRARGTFNDPNVLGAFVVLPGLIAFTRVLAGRPGEVLRSGIVLMILLAGLLLSFSRGAWIQFAVAAALTMGLMFVTSRSNRERVRIVLVAIIGLMLIAAFIAALLSLDQVAGLFKQRASLEQSYDLGPMGRFGRHVLGFMMALDYPFGIGPLQFPRYFPEDPHNSYLNAFMSGGWLSGFSYLILVATTLALGLRFVFVTTPWRTTYIAVYAAFVGTAFESAIIDSDHWRHYFLIIGVLWGLMAASRPYLRRRPAAARPAQPVAARPAEGLVSARPGT
jgi:O-antigen ligase/polysaccharide polymerase Wzy-like membrane protein